MVEFLQAIKQDDFAVWWDVAHSYKPIESAVEGLIGRYGPGYGHEEHQRDIQQKYGIHEPGFQIPSGIVLEFRIKTRRGFDFLCRFAEQHNYQKPQLLITSVRGVVKDPKKLQQAQQDNEKKTAYVEDLIQQLHTLTDMYIQDDYEITALTDTDPFYEWEKKEVYPFSYSIHEHDVSRIRSIWYDSNIMRDC